MCDSEVKARVLAPNLRVTDRWFLEANTYEWLRTQTQLRIDLAPQYYLVRAAFEIASLILSISSVHNFVFARPFHPSEIASISIHPPIIHSPLAPQDVSSPARQWLRSILHAILRSIAKGPLRIFFGPLWIALPLTMRGKRCPAVTFLKMS